MPFRPLAQQKAVNTSALDFCKTLSGGVGHCCKSLRRTAFARIIKFQSLALGEYPYEPRGSKFESRQRRHEEMHSRSFADRVHSNDRKSNKDLAKVLAGLLRDPLCMVLHSCARLAASVVRLMFNKQIVN